MKAVSKQYTRTKQEQKVLNLEPWIFFEEKNMIFRHFSNIWKFNNPCDVIKSRLGQKGVTFVYYIPTEIRRSYSITMVFSRLVIHSWDQFLRLWYYGPFLIPRFGIILKLAQKRPKFVYLVLLVIKGHIP